MTREEIREYIGADSLHYLSIEGLNKAATKTKEQNMCYACFNSQYPGSKPCQQTTENGKYVFEQGASR